jgi:hypothetical protein
MYTPRIVQPSGPSGLGRKRRGRPRKAETDAHAQERHCLARLAGLAGSQWLPRVESALQSMASSVRQRRPRSMPSTAARSIAQSG